MDRKIALQPRKIPKQTRSLQMREDILEASSRVLKKYGAPRFTTLRVAEEAGISVGSLYQYFPNKESLLFALHEREMRKTWKIVQGVLQHPTWSPREKIRRIAEHFFEVEAAEPTPMRALLEDAQVYFRETKEHRELLREATLEFSAFVKAAIPGVQDADFVANLLMTTIESQGKSVAGRGYDREEILRWSNACSDMLCGYLNLP